MIEKNFPKKITPYLDGSLTPEERSEFEAYVSTHPELEGQIRTKEEEINRIRAAIPMVTLSPRTLESMQHEIKQSVFNLLKEEPKNFWESVRNWFEEWTSR